MRAHTPRNDDTSSSKEIDVKKRKTSGNIKFRKWLAGTHPDAVLLEGPEFDGGILGMAGSRVVYGYEELAETLAAAWSESVEKDPEDAYRDAIDWIEFNTIRSLPYAGPNAPILVTFDPEREVMVDVADYSDEPKEFVYDSSCPGLTGRKGK